ncbi:MAG: hypothetical protein ACREU8_00235 [Gammaproteobacteria bacterium]
MSAVASRVASAAPELEKVLPLQMIDPEKLASGIATRLGQLRSQQQASPAVLADRLASGIANKLASLAVVSSPRMRDRFNRRVASAVLRKTGAMPMENVDASVVAAAAKGKTPETKK